MDDLICKRCGHEWTPLKENPKTCPRCKSYVWNKSEDELGDEEWKQLEEEWKDVTVGELKEIAPDIYERLLSRAELGKGFIKSQKRKK